jgi:hypothetical protein
MVSIWLKISMVARVVAVASPICLVVARPISTVRVAATVAVVVAVAVVVVVAEMTAVVNLPLKVAQQLMEATAETIMRVMKKTTMMTKTLPPSVVRHWITVVGG